MPAKDANDANDAKDAKDAKDADEQHRQFREALERKHARDSGTHGSSEENTGKVHQAHGPAKAQRTFRRKSGG
jgi:hypothetical protein